MFKNEHEEIHQLANPIQPESPLPGPDLSCFFLKFQVKNKSRFKRCFVQTILKWSENKDTEKMHE